MAMLENPIAILLQFRSFRPESVYLRWLSVSGHTGHYSENRFVPSCWPLMIHEKFEEDPSGFCSVTKCQCAYIIGHKSMRNTDIAADEVI